MDSELSSTRTLRLLILLCIFAVALSECHGWFRGRRQRRRTRPPPPSQDCEVSAWSTWTDCSRVCARGSQTRYRTITKQSTGHGSSCPSLTDRQRCGSFNGGCSQICTESSKSAPCSCYSNYELQPDKKTCLIKDACTANGGRGDCDQICYLRPDRRKGYVCDCKRGYYLDSDGKTCHIENCGKPYFPRCPWSSYSDAFGNACAKVQVSCPSGTDFGDKCLLSCPNGFGIVQTTSTQLPFLKDYVPAEFQNVPNSISCDLDRSLSPVWSSESVFYEMFCRRTNDPPTSITLSNSRFKEHSPIGTVIGNLVATDPQKSQSFVFTIEPWSSSYLFDIQKDQLVTKWVPTNRDLNGSPSKSYSIKIKATDSAKDNPMYLTKTFQVYLINVNDPPYGIELSTTTVPNLAPVDHIIGTLSAVDQDGPSKNLRTSDFVWTLVDDNQGRFKLSGANLIVAKSLSADGKKLLPISVKCTDKDLTSPQSSQVTQLYINVVDKNDPPKSLTFTSNLLFENSAIGFVVGKLSATDNNGDSITFDLSASDQEVKDRFRVDVPTCNTVFDLTSKKTICSASVVLKQGLNYESAQSYTLKVVAMDKDGSKTLKEFTILVLDVNEKPFDIKLSSYSVTENLQENVLVAIIKVADPDNVPTPRQAHICTLKDPAQSPLKITGMNVLVKENGKIDYETMANHQIKLTITCTDNGLPVLSITKDIVMQVIDVNEAPTNLRLSKATVREDAPVGYVVGLLTADDPDSTPQGLTYTSVRSSGASLGIGGNNLNELIVKAALDYETQPKLDVIVKVTDQGGLSDEKIFAINVQDVNEAPTDVRLLYHNMTENSPPDTLVTAVDVEDPDKGSTHTCKVIQPDSGYLYFSKKGLYATQKAVDYEAIPNHQFQLNLQCTDNGGLSITKSFTLTVIDINEQPTKVEVTAQKIRENEAGATFGQIVVQDPDTNQGHTCEVLANGQTHPEFEVDPSTLKLKTKGSLDFEKYSNYPVIVRCMDQPVESWQKKYYKSSDLIVYVLDVNEPPQAPCPDRVYISEEGINGTVVHTFLAYDPDNEAYHRTSTSGGLQPVVQPKQSLVYSMYQPPSDLPFFIVDDQYLVLTKKLQRGQIVKFKVTVTDDGTILSYTPDNKLVYSKAATLSENFACEAEVLPASDPRLAADIALTSNVVSEHARNGTVVGEIRILKPKLNEKYTLTLPDESSPFALDGNKLIVANAALINYEVTKKLRVLILLSDTKGITKDRVFTINVTDVNGRPTDLCLVGDTIKEGLDPGTKIGTVVVVDPDFPNSQQICSDGVIPADFKQNYACELTSSGDLASLSVTATLLTSRITFDVLKQKSYVISVLCKDSTDQSIQISKSFTISVIPSGCKGNTVFVNGACACKTGFSGPKCDRTDACNNANCYPNVCVSHYLAKDRCIGIANQVPLLIRQDITVFVNNAKEKVHQLEELLEDIFEGRSGNRNLQSILPATSIRKRRAIPSDVYVESTGEAPVGSYSYIIAVAMDPNKDYSALPGAELCPKLEGKGLRCVNEEDCAILKQHKIPCPYGSGGLDASKGTDKKEASTGVQEPVKISLIALAFVALAVLAVAGMCFVRRRRRSKERKAIRTFDDTVQVGNGLHANPVYCTPDALNDNRRDSTAWRNNFEEPTPLEKKPNIDRVTNNLYDSVSSAPHAVNNPVYGASPPPAYDQVVACPIYESVGIRAGAKIQKEVVDLGKDDADIKQKLKVQLERMKEKKKQNNVGISNKAYQFDDMKKGGQSDA